mmetsp:Transcript_68818/g.80229  ORF Transcript_68818/g.80229 Transcript_68818/m.80229 type:complete len:191 (-) Transcript_68818:413-985(-)
MSTEEHSNWKLWVEVAAGAAVAVLLLSGMIFCICRSRRRRAAILSKEHAVLIADGEEDAQHGDGGTAGRGVGGVYGTVSLNSSGEWMFGELDYSGLKRVLDWLADVRRAFAKHGGIDPIADEVIVDSARLGQIDDIGSPPQGGYSPRVSAIGSDEGSGVHHSSNRGGPFNKSGGGAHVVAMGVSRDPLRR